MMVSWYVNLAYYALPLQRFDEARQIIHQAQARKLDHFYMHNALYALAFLGGDSEAMAEQQKVYAGQARLRKTGDLRSQSDTEAYTGHLGKSAATDQAGRGLCHNGRTARKNGAIWLAIAAQREAAYGNAAQGRQLAAEALKLAPASSGAEKRGSPCPCHGGRLRHAPNPCLRTLRKRFPSGHADASHFGCL